MVATLWLLSLSTITLITTSECVYAPPPLVKYRRLDNTQFGIQVIANNFDWQEMQIIYCFRNTHTAWCRMRSCWKIRKEIVLYAINKHMACILVHYVPAGIASAQHILFIWIYTIEARICEKNKISRFKHVLLSHKEQSSFPHFFRLSEYCEHYFVLFLIIMLKFS